jgi:cytochrome P450
MRENDRLIAEAQAKGVTHNILKIEKEEILQQLISFYFAGIDTTGHLVAFSIYCLAEYPEYREKIIAEIKSVFGGSIENITYENLGVFTCLYRNWSLQDISWMRCCDYGHLLLAT